MKNGLIEVYTGDGKGKTSASVGLCVRARGHNFKVLFVQFIKGSKTGEIEPLKTIGVDILRDEGTSKFIFEMNSDEKRAYKSTEENLFSKAKEKAPFYDVVVLDEILGAVSTEMIEFDELMDFLKDKPKSCELILTGRTDEKIIKKLSDVADLVSSVNMEKHPYEKGIAAREGIEF